ncbi:hypothetical protein GCM10008938_37040 [Deinococcus roseus]|uniref:Uncharacterized protein n=2 Tax=Deinococcus roseus TaxID=392414 RepID=A0ABQ2D8Y7_9DEIO|nr:hypothetical protein GCM10008938_37040 [Deinococcus roseus]
MPEQDQPSQQEPLIGYDLFVVLDQPKVMWTIDARDEQVRFLKGLRPDYWRYLAETHGPAAEDATSPHKPMPRSS